MKKPQPMRGLSDVQLSAFVASLPEGLAVLDDVGRIVWANRFARQLLALHIITSADDPVGAALGALVAQLVGTMPPLRSEEYARWSVSDGGVVEVSLRRLSASQVALRLTAPLDLARTPYADDSATAPTPWQLIVAERMLEESAVGLVVANAAGRIDWMNPQADRLLGAASRRMGRDARRGVARAARHVASEELRAPIRMRVELPTRVVGALFWNVAPATAGVLFDDDVELVRAPWRERLIA
jgi:PAS domain-containing protein